MKSRKEKALIGLGVWLFVLPFLGFPQTWKTWLVAATGLAIVYFAALLLKQSSERQHASSNEMRTETFTETIEPSL